MSGDMKTDPLATAGTNPSGGRRHRKRRQASPPANDPHADSTGRGNAKAPKSIHRNLGHRCGKCLIKLDAGSDRSKAPGGGAPRSKYQYLDEAGEAPKIRDVEGQEAALAVR